MTQNINVSRVLTPDGWVDNKSILIRDGIIEAIDDIDDKQACLPGSLLPGYIDTQVNGGGGVLFNNEPSYASIKTLAAAHLQFGTTSLLPTLITDDFCVMEKAADAIAEAMAHQHPSVLGIHYEGPHLSKAKKGVHDSEIIRAPSDRELDLLCRNDLGKVMVTVAPETVPADIIRELVCRGVIVALGHSNAHSELVSSALSAGASGFTHLFNAMSQLTSREPGMAGQALLDEEAYCGLIVDHHHLHRDTAKLAIRVKTPQRIMLVTDAMAHTGSNMNSLAFFGTQITRTGDMLTTPDGTLAGSCLDMHSAVVNTHNDLHVPLQAASIMASATPAHFLKLEKQHGAIAVGQRADMILIDKLLSIQQIWQRGTPIQ